MCKLTTPSLAVTDYFQELQKIEPLSNVSSDLLQKGKEEPSTDLNKKIYTFTSEDYSHPHILHITDNKVIFIQLTIPLSEKEKYKEDLNNAGKPELILPKARSEILVSFPSKGIAYIIEGYVGSVLRVQKFPQKESSEFIKSEGRNFEFVPYNPKTASISTNQRSSQVTLVNWQWLILVVFFVALLIFLLRRLRKKGSVIPPSLS